MPPPPRAALARPAAVVSAGGGGELNPRGTGSTCHCGVRRGACLLCRLLPPCLYLLFCPLSPHPPSPVGKGENQSFLMQGASPLASPRLNPRGTCSTCPVHVPGGGLAPAALARPAIHIPGGGVPSESPVRRKTDRTAFLWAKPAAKERGDRGRGTSAFEMVLSPGAGIASAAQGKPPLRFPQRQGQQVPPPAQARGSRGLRSRKNPAKPLTKHGFCDILSPELHRESGVLG